MIRTYNGNETKKDVERNAGETGRRSYGNTDIVRVVGGVGHCFHSGVPVSAGQKVAVRLLSASL